MAERRPGGGLDRADAVILAAGALGALALGLAEWRIAGGFGFPLDDSWIHLRVADNVARGRGFGINPGEPVAVSTAPLWSLALAGLLAIGIPALVAGKLLGLAAFGATGLLTRRLAAALGLAPAWALGAGLAAVAVGRLLWGALAGMEVPLAAALVAAGGLHVARGRDDRAAGLLGLATLARPEAGLLATLHVLGARTWGGALRRGVLVGLFLAPYALFSLATTGRVVPSTAAAKTVGGMVGVGVGQGPLGPRSLGLAVDFAREWVTLLTLDHVALPTLVLAGLVVLRASALRGLLAALVLHPVVTALVAPVPGHPRYVGRYSSHLLPLAIVAAVAALARGWGWFPRRARPVVLGALLLGLLWPLPAMGTLYAWSVQNINAQQVALGHWLASHTPPDAVLAVNDIGAIPFFSDRYVIDLVGLATPEILAVRRPGGGGLLPYLARRCPEYLVIFPAWYPELARRGDLFRPVTQVTLAHNVISGGDTMVVYRTPWHGARASPSSCPSPE